jgi:pSer/pThr/pTyr-binding forkhead associated (FHA) protein
MGVSAVQVSPEPQRQPVWRRYTAYEVKKTGRNVFARGITLGRAPNNDVWLSMPEVSHFHAWLVAENGAWRVFDAQSSNGTFVNNNQAKPGADQGLLMRPQDELRLGDIAFAFFDGESLHRWLTAQRSR